MDSKGELQELDANQLPLELKSKIVFRAVLTRVYETVSARNTYGSASWLGLYHYSEGFSLGQAGAKRRATTARVQGSTWTVKGLPATAFVSDDVSLIVAEVDTDKPFGDHLYDETCRPYLGAIAARFREDEQTPLRLWTVSRSDFLEVNGPIEEWKSESNGGGYPLSWRRVSSTNDYDLSGIRSVLTSYHRSLELCAFFGLVHTTNEGGAKIEWLHDFAPLRLEGLQQGNVVRAVDNQTRRLKGQSLDDAIANARPGDVLEFYVEGYEQPISHRLLSFRDVAHGISARTIELSGKRTGEG